jgi:hypothetical protein
VVNPLLHLQQRVEQVAPEAPHQGSGFVPQHLCGKGTELMIMVVTSFLFDLYDLVIQILYPEHDSQPPVSLWPSTSLGSFFS